MTFTPIESGVAPLFTRHAGGPRLGDGLKSMWSDAGAGIDLGAGALAGVAPDVHGAGRLGAGRVALKMRISMTSFDVDVRAGRLEDALHRRDDGLSTPRGVGAAGAVR